MQDLASTVISARSVIACLPSLLRRNMLDELQERADQLGEQAKSQLSPGSEHSNEGIGQVENLIALATAMAAAVAARHTLQASWRHAFDRDPPKNPSSRNVVWKEALLWGAVSGALVGVARIAARRGSTSLVRRIREPN